MIYINIYVYYISKPTCWFFVFVLGLLRIFGFWILRQATSPLRPTGKLFQRRSSSPSSTVPTGVTRGLYKRGRDLVFVANLKWLLVSISIDPLRSCTSLFSSWSHCPSHLKLTEGARAYHALVTFLSVCSLLSRPLYFMCVFLVL